jgi:SAM-dependent methyltransferase
VASPRWDPYRLLDAAYLPLDRRNVRRTRNIRLIPHAGERRGGKRSYAEWAHVVGIFQTLMYLNLRQKAGNRILDVGCGTGLLGIASEPFVAEGGRYTGIDVVERDIAFCRRHYPPTHFEFVHLDAANAAYAPDRGQGRSPWPIDSGSHDLAVALSVWTHLNEADAIFYFSELCRVLAPGGRALVSFFVLDEAYEESLPRRSSQPGRFHTTAQDRWVFDQPAYGSSMWLHPEWADVPERAIGVTEAGIERLATTSGMRLVDHHPGSWKEAPGVFFQDVLVFERP